ncbi:hypothetical protein B7P43_G06128 [Cryptotermes secundus]|uniref:Caspase-1 n=2 Tax=Cryptotermes secundus TaxID=105785 RepID=A0A2J7QPW5_9NEOP|nr:hypothetical protein B7P43_G06128 [Cryptotermes secundus]
MEKGSAADADETQAISDIKSTLIQANFKPTHKRSRSDVINRTGEDSVLTEPSTRMYTTVRDEFQSCRRRSLDVVDCIGDKHGKVKDTENMTRVDGAVGGNERPTTLDMNPTVSVEWNQKGQTGTRSDKTSKEVTDSTPCTPPENSNISETGSRCVSMAVEMPVAWDASEYNMKHKRRGQAVIFNHDTFDTNDYAPREGSKLDVKKLHETFTSLLFEVTIHNNLEYSDIKEAISALAKEDHSDADCLAVIVLTHGEREGRLVPRDSGVFYNVEMLWKPFTADKCPSLAGKPKLFFIQACRGKKLDAGIKVKQRRSIEFDSSPPLCKIPTHADFLFAHSTMEGFYSFRNPDKGTWFIQSLCKELNSTDNLLQILTRATRRVTQLESESNTQQFHEQKQVPSITSMLTRDLYFHPKS